MADNQTTGALKNAPSPGVHLLPGGVGRQIARYALIGALLYNGARPDVFLLMPIWQKTWAILMFATVADYGTGLCLCAGLFSPRLRKS